MILQLSKRRDRSSTEVCKQEISITDDDDTDVFLGFGPVQWVHGIAGWGRDEGAAKRVKSDSPDVCY